MTAEQLEELLGKVTQGEWKAYEVADWRHETCMDIPSIGYDGELCKHDAALIALAPSLARRVIAAEKLVDVLNDVSLCDLEGRDMMKIVDALHAYREARK